MGLVRGRRGLLLHWKGDVDNSEWSRRKRVWGEKVS